MKTLIIALENINTGQLIFTISCFLLAGIGIWLLLREAKAWYWKTNEILENQKIEIEILEDILEEIKKISTP